MDGPARGRGRYVRNESGFPKEDSQQPTRPMGVEPQRAETGGRFAETWGNGVPVLMVLSAAANDYY